jgi:hypothetical protein
VTALIILFSTSSVAKIGAILLGGIAGLWLCRSTGPTAASHMGMPVSRTVGLLALAVFLLLLGVLPILVNVTRSQAVALFDAFYRSGALVFGGGHVVLPLLREATVAHGWVSDDVFLTGYGAAQAVPGPLFTFSAYLGAVMKLSPMGSRALLSASLRFSFPVFWHFSRHYRFGNPLGKKRGRRPLCAASMRRWSVSLARPSTIRFGRLRSVIRQILRLLLSVSFC